MQDILAPLLWLITAILLIWKQIADIRNNNKGTDGSVANEVSQAWEKFNEPLLKEMGELRDRIEKMELRETQHLRLIGELVRGAKIHFGQLDAARIQSAWVIPDDLKPLFDQVANTQIAESVTIPISKRNNRSGFSRK